MFYFSTIVYKVEFGSCWCICTHSIGRSAGGFHVGLFYRSVGWFSISGLLYRSVGWVSVGGLLYRSVGWVFDEWNRNIRNIMDGWLRFYDL